MSVGFVSFTSQMSHWRAGQAAANSHFLSSGTSLGSIDVFANASSTAANSFASAASNYMQSAAILAAQTGAIRTAQAATTATSTKSQPDQISDQISYNGTISGVVDFGINGPSSIGGFQFAGSSDLQSAFQSAMFGQTSNGEPIDTVSVSGRTLTASTSGDTAHDVFTLTLSPVSGAWTFSLLNPIDLSTLTSDPSVVLDLTKLMQGVKSNGQTVELSSPVQITIDGDQYNAKGTATTASLHEGGLAYTPPPSATAAAAAPAAYTPPTNPLTGKGYAATSAGAQAIGVTLSLFA